jgi:nitric oxide dioxygenase
MISEASLPYIDASVPVLRQHGPAITRLFYKDMLETRPELTRLFNMGNQAQGVQQQSLAAAVFAYAANIRNPGALGPVVNRIVHKHVSVGLRAEHYPIVGHHLLKAIADTLGDGATAPLMDAWKEAYNALARVLISAEAEMYSTAGIQPGETRPMRVTELKQESDNVLSVRFVADDGKALPPFKPGQYVSVAVDLPGERHQLRQYSLSDAPGADSLRISVKREDSLADAPAGEVSNWLHANLRVGSVLQVSHPFGDFVPDTESDGPIVLLSGGIGITPMVASLKRIAQAQPLRRVIFAHAARNAGHHAFRAEVDAIKALMPNLAVVNFYEDAQGTDGVVAGRMDIGKLPAWAREEASVYLCGPHKFMQAQWLALLNAGVPAGKLHREVFGPELLDHLL